MDDTEKHIKDGKVDAEGYYRASLIKLTQSVIDAVSASQATQGLPSGGTGKRFWASVLFARLCGLSMSLQRLLPGSVSNKRGRHWDSAAALTLCRSAFDGYLAMFYLCGDEMSDEDYQLRISLVFLHDCEERPRILGKTGASIEITGKEFYAKEGERLRSEISKNTVFVALPPSKQKRVLEGRTPYYLSQDELLQRQGADAVSMRGVWEFLSSHVHSYPFSFFRVIEQKDRGSGRENEADKHYCAIAAELTSSILDCAVRDMKKLFVDVPVFPRCVIDWETIMCTPIKEDSGFVLGMASPKAGLQK